MTARRNTDLPFEDLSKRVVLHGIRSGSIPQEVPFVYLFRAMSDLDGLAEAEKNGDTAAIREAVGHVLMRLVHYCARRQVDPVECLSRATFQKTHPS